MTPRERVLAVLRGEPADKTPFTAYHGMIPQCAMERHLRNEGLCLVYRGVPAVRIERSHCPERIIYYTNPGNGRLQCRVEIETPAGMITIVKEPADFTTWVLEHMFKGPEDYKKLMAFTRDIVYVPNYDAYLKAEARTGGDMIFRGDAGDMPLHQIMIEWMGVETFAVEWAERRDEVLALEKVMTGKLRERFPLLADAPITHANFGGNEVPEVMGPPRYREHCLPLIQECAEVLHKKGKLLGSHMDGNNLAWKDQIAVSGMDYVEAFTPAPDTDMSLADALEAWPGKALWINFPSSVHLASPDKIRRKTRELLDAAAADAKKRGRNRLIIGLTEDIPEDRWQASLQAISDEIGRW
ncbi:MAG: uroporphyrinogen decarboxylase family protein [Verrucomicrobiota bacterium]|nr:uroporphyrinogen decarboxylase family protein [Verrucomicrobiota bacterium]